MALSYRQKSYKNRVVILGGGIAGLAIARMLEPYFDDIIIIEKNSKLGGLCISEHFNGIAVDICGGHIFNTKDNEVRDFVFSIKPKADWVKSNRNAKIFMEEKLIGFPFENHMFQISEQFARTCIGEIQLLRMPAIVNNWRAYLLHNFGKTACERYYFPYNQKIWQYPLDKISTDWINKDKLPVPNLKIIEQANEGVGASNTSMTHSSFYSPQYGGIESFLEALFPQTASIFTGTSLQKLQYDTQVKAWLMQLDSYDGETIELHADFVINTTPVNQLFKVMDIDFPPLPYHGTDILVCMSDFFVKNKEVSWTYFPEKKYWWHKISHLAYLTGSPGSHGLILVDAPGNSTLKQTKINIPGYHFTTLATYQHAMTYPIEPVKSVADMGKLHILLQNLRGNGLFSIGRWGRHKYANIDVVIRDALDTKREIVASL
jgi:hypothetical protein